MSKHTEHAAAEAARIGEELRAARLSRGMTVDEMAARLRIRRPYLDALEEGRVRDLPGTAYAIGFVRSYAAALGLDPEQAARPFRDLAGGTAPKSKLVFPEPVPERGMPAFAVVITGAVVATFAYVAWFNWSGGGDRVVDVVPPVPPRLETAAEQGRSQMPGSTLPSRADAGAVPIGALPPPGGLPPLPPGGGLPAPSQSGANTSAQAATVASAGLTGAALRAPEPSAQAPGSAMPGVPDGTRIVLRARAGSQDGAWVQVRDARSGQVLVNRVLRPNEVWPAPVREGLLLDTGKADGLEILLDGQPQPTLEGLVGVRRNIALEPDRLRQRLVPATAAAAPRT